MTKSEIFELMNAKADRLASYKKTGKQKVIPDCTAKQFIERLEAHRSPVELAKMQRYFRDYYLQLKNS